MFILLLLTLLFGFRIDATTYEVDAELLSECKDGLPVVFVDTITWTLYGDQDKNGRLDGEDCNWR